jgi:molybdopterin biosynthesis enzyme
MTSLEDLEDAYAAAFEEWETAGESRLWDEVAADGIEVPTRGCGVVHTGRKVPEHP